MLHRVGREGASCCEVPRQPLTWQREKSQELVKVQFSRELFVDDFFGDLCPLSHSNGHSRLYSN